MAEAAIDAAPDPGPRTITVQRRWAITGTIASALVIVALAVALIVSGGDSQDHPVFGGPGGPGYGAIPEQAQGMPTPPQVMTPPMPTDPAPQSGRSNGNGSGSTR